MNTPEKVISLTCKIPNIRGLHARASAQIVTLSGQYDCEITISHKGKSASSLSLIKLLTLNAPQGSLITIQASGEQARSAVEEIQALILRGFGE